MVLLVEPERGPDRSNVDGDAAGRVKGACERGGPEGLEEGAQRLRGGSSGGGQEAEMQYVPRVVPDDSPAGRV